MPAIFHKVALIAAGGEGVQVVPDAALEDWSALSKLLDGFTPEQRCDAVYADWLLQLQSPAHPALLQIRNLLLGQGALAANYLAELAQNADDASDGLEAAVAVDLWGDWLLVGNNGRKVTSINLLGLCRFFIHAAGKIRELDATTIGKFGIGFKSSYRIASEVIVHSWDKAGTLTFRLPICRDGEPDSVADQARLQRIESELRAAGAVQQAAVSPADLGYCTPEALPAIPEVLEGPTAALRRSERGTVFAFHLRKEKQAEVRSRVSGQAEQLYEICPLFLPNLRSVRFGPHEMRMRVGQHDPKHDLIGRVRADRITLSTAAVGQPQSHSRFWRLTGVGEGDRWQLALHADSQHRLRIDAEDDEHGLRLQDGAAYGFFPLNSASRAWPFRLHLHLSLPTNLARDDWNPDERPQVEVQLRLAVAGLCGWLEAQAELWHPKWRIQHLIKERPHPGQPWASLIWDALLLELKRHRLLKTVWGGLETADRARTIRIVDEAHARSSWESLYAVLPNMGDEFPLVDNGSGVDLGLGEFGDEDLRAFFLRAAGQIEGDLGRQVLVSALFTAETAEPDTLEAVCDKIPISCRDYTQASLSELLERPAGADLPDSWHAVFGNLRSWLWTSPHGLTSLSGSQLRMQLQKLSVRVFNPPWEALAIVLATQEAWQRDGEAFWQLQRTPCPSGMRALVTELLRVRDGSPGWKEITSVWLVDNSPVNCFHGVVAKWERGTAANNAAQQDKAARLRAWHLWEEWQDAVEARLKSELPGKLHALLAATDRGDPFEGVFGGAHANSRDRLPTRWSAVVIEAEKAATARFIRERVAALGGVPLLTEGIDPGLRSFLVATGLYVQAPAWLTEAAIDKIRAAGVGDLLDGLIIYRPVTFTDTFKRELGSWLARTFHSWGGRSYSDQQLSALNRLCESIPITERRNWSVALTSRTSVLLCDLLNPAPGTTLGQSTADRPAKDTVLNSPLLALPDIRWQSEKLPELLSKVPAIAAASLVWSNLSVEILPSGRVIEIEESAVDPSLRGNALFNRLLHDCEGQLSKCAAPLSIRWLHGDRLVAELRQAQFVVLDCRVLTHCVRQVFEDRQFTEVLSLYRRSARGGPEFEQFQKEWAAGNIAHRDLYDEHRKEIVETLLQTQVRDQGYGAEHIIRELLQNAESAYDSQPNERPAVRDFEFSVAPAGTPTGWVGTASHSGRQFNQNLRDGNPRDDIRLIVSTPSAETPPTEGWIGRFNRGFKSIFTVAKRVEITSGGFRFAIEDMLLLDPPEPKPDQQHPSPRTQFEFQCAKGNVGKLLKVSGLEGAQRKLPVLDATSFVFLQWINQVRIRAGHWKWEWAIERSGTESGWQLTEVRQSFPARQERFMVYAGSHVGVSTRRFAVAVWLGPVGHGSLPQRLEPEWRNVRLTFATEDAFPLDVLVNGDFETDSGRMGIRDSPANEALMGACLRATGELCAREVGRSPEPKCWLAWAEVLHLPDGEKELAQRFTHHETLGREFEALSDFLCENIPHEGEFCSSSDLTFPSTLLRRLESIVRNWGFPTRNWISAEVEALLPRKVRDEHSKQTLDGLLGQLPRHALEGVRRDFTFPGFLTATERLSGPERDELERARVLLDRVDPPPSQAQPPPEELEWTVAQLCAAWEAAGEPIEEYTLDGANWELLFPRDQTPAPERPRRLRAALTESNSEMGRRIWYRVLGLACLMSGAGHGRISSLREFWIEQLENPRRDFWNSTAAGDFSEITRPMFAELAARTANPDARSEAADYWRHVFYDVRKVHELIWQHRFVDTIQSILADSSRVQLFPRFLRDGQLPGQAPWAGVLGQSAGAPLFFLTRELCRLGVVDSPDLRPLAFFVCTPVRRAAERIRWLPAGASGRSDFQSLARWSEMLHEKVEADPMGERLLPCFDIPLLHLGLTR